MTGEGLSTSTGPLRLHVNTLETGHGNTPVIYDANNYTQGLKYKGRAVFPCVLVHLICFTLTSDVIFMFTLVKELLVIENHYEWSILLIDMIKYTTK